jgi:4-amino-4-deoxy-L-arabinose transferase-like glycosyltransferase
MSPSFWRTAAQYIKARLHPATRALLVLVAGTLALRLLFAASLGLGIDESYTAATARQQPQLAYFDHPPATWWLAWAAGTLFGSQSPIALRLPFLLLFGLSTWLMFALTRRLFGAKAAIWAATTLNLAPVLAWTSGTWVVPDGPLNTALLAGTVCIAEALFGKGKSAWLWWLAAGVCGGVALLCKFHGTFLFVGVGLFLLTQTAHRKWLVSPWPYASGVVALLIFLPVLVWNEQHGWVSLAFQASRARHHAFDPSGPIVAVAGQALYLLPWIWLPLVMCLVKAAVRGPADQPRWLMACLAIGPIATFTLVGFTGNRILPHWAAPGYLMLFPLLGAHVAEGLASARPRVRTWLITSALSMAVVLAGVIALTWLPWPVFTLPDGRRLPYPLIESLDWTNLMPELASRGLLGAPGLFIVATRWHEAGKIDYALRGQMPVVCLSLDPRNYGVLKQPRAYLGQDALIVGRNLSPERIDATYGAYFASIERLPPITITHGGAPMFDLSVFLAHSLHSTGAQPNLLDPLSLK